VIKSRRIRWKEHGTCRHREELFSGFCWGNPTKRDKLENLGGDGSIILKLNAKIDCAGVDWTDLSPNRDKWRVVVKAICNFGFYK
jgi:hypothetical protein